MITQRGQRRITAELKNREVRDDTLWMGGVGGYYLTGNILI